MSVLIQRLVACCALCVSAAGCNSAPAASHEHEAPVAKPSFVHGAVPVAAFVAEQLALAPANQKTFVYVGASWCEPCQRFHRALESGALDAQLRGVRFIEYDSDAAHDALVIDGYTSRLIPLFAAPNADGRASDRSDRRIEGSIKGDGAVANIMPRLLELLGPAQPAVH